jgi:hypothetical protein
MAENERGLVRRAKIARDGERRLAFDLVAEDRNGIGSIHLAASRAAAPISCYAKRQAWKPLVCQIGESCTAAQTAIPGFLVESRRTVTRSLSINPTRLLGAVCHTLKWGPS